MRLYIYDEQEERHGKHSAGDDPTTTTVPVSNIDGLRGALGQLVKDRKTFRRVLWYTHGSPGQISFGDSNLTFASVYDLTGYEALFPLPTKMFFQAAMSPVVIPDGFS
jgi:hypothetical protein